MNACAMEGGIPNADFHEGVNAYVQYGENLDFLVAPVISKIKEKLVTSPVLHFDETEVRDYGKRIVTKIIFHS